MRIITGCAERQGSIIEEKLEELHFEDKVQNQTFDKTKICSSKWPNAFQQGCWDVEEHHPGRNLSPSISAEAVPGFTQPPGKTQAQPPSQTLIFFSWFARKWDWLPLYFLYTKFSSSLNLKAMHQQARGFPGSPRAATPNIRLRSSTGAKPKASQGHNTSKDK